MEQRGDLGLPPPPTCPTHIRPVGQEGGESIDCVEIFFRYVALGNGKLEAKAP